MLRKSKILILVVLSFLLIGVFSVFAKETYLKYLPRNEKLLFISKDYPLRTEKLISDNGTICNATNSFRQAERCNICGLNRQSCPDCCLINPSNSVVNAVKCTFGDPVIPPEVSRLFFCNAVQHGAGGGIIGLQNYWFFFSNELFLINRRGDHSFEEYLAAVSTTIPKGGFAGSVSQCQELGCAIPIPSPQFGQQCFGSASSNVWFCNTSVVPPQRSPCNLTEYGQGLISGSQNYDITSVSDDSGCSVIPPTSTSCPCSAVGLASPCFRYDNTNALATVGACVKFSRDFEIYENETHKCKAEACVGIGTTIRTSCIENVCDERIRELTTPSHPCAPYSNLAMCGALFSQANNCLMSKFSTALVGCKSCFQEIDPLFNGTFVGKTKEAVVVIAKVNLHQMKNTNVPSLHASMFFSFRMRVFELNDTGGIIGDPIHESIVFQRSLSVSTSNAAIENDIGFDSATVLEPSIIQPGRRYKIQLLYYFPNIYGDDWQIWANSLSLTMYKIRE